MLHFSQYRLYFYCLERLLLISPKANHIYTIQVLQIRNSPLERLLKFIYFNDMRKSLDLNVKERDVA